MEKKLFKSRKANIIENQYEPCGQCTSCNEDYSEGCENKIKLGFKLRNILIWKTFDGIEVVKRSNKLYEVLLVNNILTLDDNEYILNPTAKEVQTREEILNLVDRFKEWFSEAEQQKLKQYFRTH